jgi:hypothetical protein
MALRLVSVTDVQLSLSYGMGVLEMEHVNIPNANPRIRLPGVQLY